MMRWINNNPRRVALICALLVIAIGLMVWTFLPKPSQEPHIRPCDSGFITQPMQERGQEVTAHCQPVTVEG